LQVLVETLIFMKKIRNPDDEVQTILKILETEIE